MSQAAANKLLLGSIFFQFDTENSVEYLIEVVNPILGNDGFRLVRHWQQSGKSLQITVMDYFANVTDAIRFALEAWSGYIMKDEMPECIVTGALDAEDVRDMMLYIQEPELWEEGETPPTIEAVEIDPLELALNAMGETIDGLLHHLTVVGHVPAIYDEIESLTCTVALIRSLVSDEKEIDSNE